MYYKTNLKKTTSSEIKVTEVKPGQLIEMPFDYVGFKKGWKVKVLSLITFPKMVSITIEKIYPPYAKSVINTIPSTKIKIIYE